MPADAGRRPPFWRPCMRIPRVAVLFLSLLLGSAAPSLAQIAGELSGRVLDPSGAGVGDASVMLVNGSTNVRQTTVSTRSGDYVFINLNPGPYRVEVSASGFNPLT